MNRLRPTRTDLITCALSLLAFLSIGYAWIFTAL